MKKIILLYVLCIFGLSLYAQQVPNVLRRGGADSAECREWVEKQLSEMSLKEKIGQLFIHTVAPLNTQSNRANIYNAVKEYKVGGLLFSGGQVGNQAILTNYAQELSKVPLFIAFDGEWGLAMRLKNTPRFPRNRVLGCIQDNQLLYEYGKEVARQCKEIGVQINFAPVADVDINPRNPVINTRSFGGDPKNVAQKVVAYSRGLEDGGVLSVAKHFPGHGDTEVDSHKALPVLNFDRARLDSIELYPFKEVIHAGLGGIMAGHLEVPELGKNPASLSAHVIDNLLCRELGFRGLVFTDALEMKGVSQNENLCAKALKAGNDLLLAPRNLKRELNGVLEAVKSGWLSPLAGFDLYKSTHERIQTELVGKTTADGTVITGHTAHFMERMFGTLVDPDKLKYDLKIIRRSGVGYEAMRDTVLNPERINPVKTDSRGKRSVRLIGKAIVTINPDTGQLIQLNPRSEQK
jgi:beta-glucosidase-like glycosyl hydrolase